MYWKAYLRNLYSRVIQKQLKPGHTVHCIIIYVYIVLTTQDVTGCTEDNIDYAGHDIAAQSNVESASACRNLCQQNSGCNFWTWVKPTYNGRHGAGIRLTCHLKSNDAGRVVLAGLLSGTKICTSGNNILFVGLFIRCRNCTFPQSDCIVDQQQQSVAKIWHFHQSACRPV